MAKLILSDYKEDVVETSKWWIFSLDINFRNYYLSIKHPIKKEEFIYLAKGRTRYNHDTRTTDVTLIDKSWGNLKLARKNAIITAVNRLEAEGYYVKSDQLALFINEKINMLIMESKNK